MESLGTYLAKYRGMEPPQASTKRYLSLVVKDECGVELKGDQISLRGGGAFLSVHPTERSEIMIASDSILKRLREAHNVRLAFVR